MGTSNLPADSVALGLALAQMYGHFNDPKSGDEDLTADVAVIGSIGAAIAEDVALTEGAAAIGIGANAIAATVDLAHLYSDRDKPDEARADFDLLDGDLAGLLASIASVAEASSPEVVIGLTVAAALFNFAGNYLEAHKANEEKEPIEAGKPGFSDPLVLDLAGSGILTSAVSGSSAYFDYSGGGVKVQTGWIQSGEGILVLAPADGATVLASDVLGASSGSGFGDLSAFDLNGDGVIDANDAVYSRLRVWVDSNGDGTSNTGELFTLAQLGIVSINVQDSGTYINSNGNVVVGSSTFTRSDGTSSTVYEVNFSTNPQNTVLPTQPTTVTASALELPDLDGFGLLPDLRVAMSTDPTLLQMVTDLVTGSAAMTGGEFESSFENILFRWAGVDGFDPNADGAFVDAREAGFIDAYFGENPQDVLTSSSQPNFHNGPTVWSATFQELMESYKVRFASEITQSLISLGYAPAAFTSNPYIVASLLNYDTGSNTFDGGFENVFIAAKNLVPTDPALADSYWDKIIPIIQALRWDVTSTINPFGGSALSQLALDASLAGYSSKLIAQIMDAPNPVSLGGGSYLYTSAVSTASSTDQATYVTTSSYSSGIGDDSSSSPMIFQTLNGSLYEPFLVYTAYYDANGGLHFSVGAGVNDLGSDAISAAMGDTSSSDSGLSLYFPQTGLYSSVGTSTGGTFLIAPTNANSADTGAQAISVGDGLSGISEEIQGGVFAYGVYSFGLGSGANYILSGTLGDLVLPGTLNTSNLRFEAFNNTKNLKLFYVDDEGDPTGDSVTIEDALGSSGRTIDKILLGDGSNIFPDGEVVSAWYGSASAPSLVGYDSGPNYFYIRPGTVTVTLGRSGGNTLDYATGSGHVTANLNNGGTGDVRLGADVTASNVLLQANNAGDLTIVLVDANGVATGDSLTLTGSLYDDWANNEQTAIGQLLFADGTTQSLLDPTSTWLGTVSDTTLTGSNWGANTFVLGAGGDAITFGNGSAGGGATDYNLVEFGFGDGAATAVMNGGVGDVQMGAGITANNVILQADSAGDLAVLLLDANGVPTGDSLTLKGSLYADWANNEQTAVGQLLFADGTTQSLLDPTSTWLGTVSDTTLTGSNWGANTFVLGAGGDTITFGNGSASGGATNYNLVEFGFGDGAATAVMNGGVGDVQMGAGITANNVILQADSAGDLTVLLLDANGVPTGDSLTLKGSLYADWANNERTAVGQLLFADGSTQSLYDPTSTWLGTVGDATLTGSNWGANTFVLGAGGDAITFGNGSAGGGATNYNLVEFGFGDGAATAVANGGVGDIRLGAGITASNVILQADTAGDLTVLLLDANGVPTGDTLTLKGSLYADWANNERTAVGQLLFADGTTQSLLDPTSTWLGTATDTTLTGSNWGANTFVLGAGGDAITFGNGSAGGGATNYNLVEFGFGDGAATAVANGGVGDIRLGAGITASNVILQADTAGDLTVLLLDANGVPTGDTLTLKGSLYADWANNERTAVGQLLFADGTTQSLLDPTSTWLGTATDTTLTGSNWGANTFVLGAGGDAITFGNGSAGGGATNYNLVEFGFGDGAATAVANGGVGDIRLGAGITASNVILQADTAGDLTVLLLDANGVPTGDTLTLKGSLYADWANNERTAVGQLLFADGTTQSLLDPTSTWLGTATDTTLTGSNWGANTFVLGAGGDTITFGNGSAAGSGATNDNLVDFGFGDGAAIASLNGGVGNVQLGAGVTASNVLVQADSAGDLTIVLLDGNGVATGDSLTLTGSLYKDWRGDEQTAVGELLFPDGTTQSLLDPTSTWLGTAGDTTLTGSNWGANTFVLGAGGDAIMFGNGSAGSGATNYNLVEFGFGDGAAVASLNGGAGNVQLGAGITASNVIVQADDAGDLTIALLDANGVPTGDSLTLTSSLYKDWRGNEQTAVGQLIFADGSTQSLYDATSTWLGTATDTTLTGSNWGANTFALGAGGDTITFGNGSAGGGATNYNLVEFGFGDGPATANLNGGGGDVRLAAGITASNVLVQADNAGDLTIVLLDANGVATGDSLTLKGSLYDDWRSNENTAVGQLLFADGPTQSLYDATSTWLGTARDTTLVGSNWGANTFLLGAGGDTITFGNGSAGGGATNYNLVDFGFGDGAAIASLNGGVGNVQLGAGITASNVLVQADGAGDLTIVLLDANGVATGDSLTLKGSLYDDWRSNENAAVGELLFADGTTRSLLDPTSTWLGTASDTTLTGSNWGANTFVLGAGGDTITFGNGSAAGSGATNDNLVDFGFGDGAAIASLNGGVGNVQLGAGITASNVLVQADGAGDLTIVLLDANGVATGDSLTLKGSLYSDWRSNENAAVGELLFADGTTQSLLDPTSTWLGTASDTTLTGSNWGANTFVLGAGGDAITFGNGSAGSGATNYNLVKFGLGDGAATAVTNGGVGDIQLGVGITASDVLLQADSAGDLTILLLDANGAPTGDSLTLKGSLYDDWRNNEQTAVGQLLFADGTTQSLLDPTSTWFSTNSDATLTGSNWSSINVFFGGDGDTINGVNTDIYKFGANAGVETINPSGYENADSIEFDATVNAANVTLQATGNDLVVTDAKAGIAITVAGEFWNSGGNHVHLSSIGFADGTTLSLAGDNNVALTYDGSAGNQVLTGSGWGTTNTFQGGAGDTITGANTDIYNFGADASGVTINPSGNEDADTILFDASVDETDVTLQAVGNDLIVTDQKDNVSITVKGEFWNNWWDGNHVHVNTISFADGTSISLTADQGVTLNYDGSAGDQTLSGSGWGATNIFAGAAGDTLSGANTDIFNFGAGASGVTVNPSANENADTISFDSSIDAADVTLQASGNDLIVTDEKDDVSVTVKGEFWNNWWDGNHVHVNAISFADGTNISLAGDQNVTLTFDGSAGDQVLSGSSWGATNIFEGAAGDTLSGANSDIYKFGAGASGVTINPSGNENADTIQFDSSIDGADVTLQAVGNDLVVTDEKDDVSITVKGEFYNNWWDGNHVHVNAISFADGTSVSLAGDSNVALSYDGSAGGLTLQGSSWGATNTFFGGDGDTTNGVNTDVYKFGATAGTETINPSANDNVDSIVFDNSIDMDDVTLQSSGSDLLITDQQVGMSLMIKGEFRDDTGASEAVSSISFADGTTWDNNEINGRANAAPIILDASADGVQATALADLFVVPSGIGDAAVQGFSAAGAGHDYLQFSTSQFSDWAHLLGATRQIGSDLVITIDGSNSVRLDNVALSDFNRSDVEFRNAA